MHFRRQGSLLPRQHQWKPENILRRFSTRKPVAYFPEQGNRIERQIDQFLLLPIIRHRSTDAVWKSVGVYEAFKALGVQVFLRLDFQRDYLPLILQYEVHFAGGCLCRPVVGYGVQFRI